MPGKADELRYESGFKAASRLIWLRGRMKSVFLTRQ
jgi:hypothetical protein